MDNEKPMTLDVPAICASLTKAQRRTWRNAEWQDEYYATPDLWGADWEAAKAAGLVYGRDCLDGEVSRLGDKVIRWLKMPWWERARRSVVARLMHEVAL